MKWNEIEYFYPLLHVISKLHIIHNFCSTPRDAWQWLNRLQNQDRRFMLSFTTVGVGLRKSAHPSVSVFSNLLNRHRKSIKTDGFLCETKVKRRYSMSVSAVKCRCRFRCRCQVSTVGLGSDRKPKIQLWTETGSATDAWISSALRVVSKLSVTGDATWIKYFNEINEVKLNKQSFLFVIASTFYRITDS
jgi:hypothetical protein